MSTQTRREGLRTRPPVESLPPTKTKKQIAAEKKAERLEKERAKQDGLKRIAAVENETAREHASTNTPRPPPPPPKKTSKAASKTRGQKRTSRSESEPSSDGDKDSHATPSEDVDMDQISEADGGTVAEAPPTTTRDDSGSEAVSDLGATQKKKKQSKKSLRLTVNELRGQLMAVDAGTTPDNLETPLAGRGKRNHQSIDGSVCPPRFKLRCTY